MITQKFTYHKLKQLNLPEGRRYETPSNERLPSVTTVLSATKTEEQAIALAKWRARVGHDAATAITTESAGRGTRMHKFLEEYVLDDAMTEAGTNPHSITARAMAMTVVERGLVNCSEYWGSEVPLYCPTLYAGTSDLVGVHKNEPAILDFKQSNKPKKTEHIGDYFIQLCAYMMAHNEVYGTDIKRGVILMCTPELVYQEWVLEGSEQKKYMNIWLEKLHEYYSKH
jgi:genome maintenance exonuclease 1